MQRLFLVILSLLMTIAPAARAHVDSGGAGSLLSGLLHPVTGLDHVVAMVAVGLWGAVLGAPALCVQVGGASLDADAFATICAAAQDAA